MSRKSLLLVAGALATLAIPTDAQAQLELGVDVGYGRTSVDVDGGLVQNGLSTAPGSLRVGVLLSDRILLETRTFLGWSSFSREDGGEDGGEDGSGWTLQLNPGLAFLFGEEDGARPYLMPSAGVVRSGGSEYDGHTQWSLGLHGGVRLPLVANVTGRLEGGYMRSFENDDAPGLDRISLTVGFSAAMR